MTTADTKVTTRKPRQKKIIMSEDTESYPVETATEAPAVVEPVMVETPMVPEVGEHPGDVVETPMSVAEINQAAIDAFIAHVREFGSGV